MDSLVHTRTAKVQRYRRQVMGWSALLQADLTALSRSWVVRGWLLLLVLSFFVVPVGMLIAKRQSPLPASTILTAYLAIFLNFWSTFIIVLSAGSVSLEADIVADGILCRACTRTQYILAKLAARTLFLGGIYLICAGAAGYATWRYAPNDMTWETMVTGISIVAMALLMVVSLGVAMSVIFNNTIVSVIGLLLLWYVAGTIFAFMGAEYMSPASLTKNLPQILRDANAPRVVSSTSTETSLSVLFSKKVKPETAERLDNYKVESPKGTRHTPQTAFYDDATTTAILSGFKLKPGQTVTVAVQGVTDEAGNLCSPAGDSAECRVTGTKTAVTGREDQEAEEQAPQPRRATPHANEDGKPPRVVKVIATRTSASVTFTKELKPSSAEKVKNYTVECPSGKTHTPKTAVYNSSSRTVLLSGLSFRGRDPVKVTVQNVVDEKGSKVDARHNSGTFTEVQNWKYFAGFGLPALLFAGLAVGWFSRRDL